MCHGAMLAHRLIAEVSDDRDQERVGFRDAAQGVFAVRK